MKLAELVATRMKAIETMGQRMAAKPSAELAEKLGKETLAAHAGRIEQRIARLDRQRSAMLARIDTALEAEHAALSDIRRMTEAMPSAAPRKPAPSAPTKGGAVPRKALSTKAGGAAKQVRAKPAKPH